MDSTGANTQDASEVLHDTRWCLTIVGHRDRKFLGKRMVVASGTTKLGRGAKCFGVVGVFEDGRISREHAVLELTGNELELRDLGSRNGSRVNGVRVDVRRLEVGDVLTLGKMVLVVSRAPALFPACAASTLVGASLAHCVACERIQKVARHATTVLIRGPVGAGKSALASQLHHDSGRKGELVTVPCGAIDETLLHSELFGHTKGAFPGATQSRRGLVETAKNGTLLLDSVADASTKLQLALLRFLETGQVRRLGADVAADVDVRIVATTTESVEHLVDTGRLRRDFADRLGAYEVVVAPLGDRREDVGMLADFFVQRYGGDDATLHPDLLEHILTSDWPGNARELEAYIELAVVESDGSSTIKLANAPQPANETSPHTSHRFRIASDGAWFKKPDEDAIDISDRKNLARILHVLVEMRTNAPGRALSVAELLALGWPGERVEPRSGANRVYVALTTLRRLGLRNLITRARAGYLIDPNACVDVVAETESLN